MRRINDIKKDFSYPSPVDKIYGYYAYKKGKSYGPYTDAKEAKLISSNTECVCVNQNEYDAYMTQFRQVDQEVSKIFHQELREEYSHLNQQTYDLVYNVAYDRGHSAGYDEVANYMIDYADLAEKIIAANK